MYLIFYDAVMDDVMDREMMTKIFLKKVNSMVLCTGLCFSSFTYAADIVGTWKTIDDKSGFARAKVKISEESDGTFSGKIIEVFPIPQQSAEHIPEKCLRCTGELKNKPIIGLNVIKNFKLNPKKPSEYIGGSVVDPISGNIYKGKIRLSSNQNRITLRGYVGTSILGRSQTWIRSE